MTCTTPKDLPFCWCPLWIDRQGNDPTMRRMRNGFSVLVALVWLASSFLAIYSHNNPTYIALATDIHGAFNQFKGVDQFKGVGSL